MSEQVNPVKVVCNIVDDRILALFLVHEDITLHCFLPAVSPWRICTVFYACIPSDIILLSLSVWTVRYLCRRPVKITGPMDTLPLTSIRNGSTPLPRMAMCGDTGHTTTACPASWLHLKEKCTYISSVWLSDFRAVLWLVDVIKNWYMIWYCRCTEVTSFQNLLFFKVFAVQSMKLVNTHAC